MILASATSRVRALAADAGVRATAVTRLIALAGAPVTIVLATTRLAPAVQGFYFVAVNVIALAQVFEIGLGTIIVQFASHERPSLTWNARGGLDGDPAARDTLRAILSAAFHWYRMAALILFGVAGIGGVLLYRTAYADAVTTFTVPWIAFVALTAAYLLVVPFVAVAEGCGDLLAVQRMRSWQAVALLLGLWTGIVYLGPLPAACLGAAAQLGVAIVWLLVRHPGLLRMTHPMVTSERRAEQDIAGRYRNEQHRSAQLWLSLWLAPQMLTPIALKLHGGDASGRLGATLAVALAPLTLALAWLHGRYPSYGMMVAEGRTAEFDRLTRRATFESISVFGVGAAGVTGLVLLLPTVAPAVAARILPLGPLFALLAGALASLVLQAMAGWLRAFRDERIAMPIVVGAAATILASAIAATVSDVALESYAFAAASLGIAIPVAAIHFRRVRRERLAEPGVTRRRAG